MDNDNNPTKEDNMTINEILNRIAKESLTAEEGARELGEDSYAMKYYECTAEEVRAFWALEDAYKTMYPIKSEVVIPEETFTVVCSCGCSITESLVMTASFGSSCPDCYDKMSL